MRIECCNKTTGWREWSEKLFVSISLQTIKNKKYHSK